MLCSHRRTKIAGAAHFRLPYLMVYSVEQLEDFMDLHWQFIPESYLPWLKNTAIYTIYSFFSGKVCIWKFHLNILRTLIMPFVTLYDFIVRCAVDGEISLLWLMAHSMAYGSSWKPLFVSLGDEQYHMESASSPITCKSQTVHIRD